MQIEQLKSLQKLTLDENPDMANMLKDRYKGIR